MWRILILSLGLCFLWFLVLGVEKYVCRMWRLTLSSYVADVLAFGIQDPRLLAVGGNTGTTNSFTGLDVASLTDGVFNGATLAEGNNLECFVFQLVQSEAPGLVTSLYEDVTAALQPLAESISSNLAGLNCPQLQSVEMSQYDIYPGYSRAKGV